MKGQLAMTDRDNSTRVKAKAITGSRRRDVFCMHRTGMTQIPLRQSAALMTPTF